jgi:hypothetical protein
VRRNDAAATPSRRDHPGFDYDDAAVFEGTV